MLSSASSNSDYLSLKKLAEKYEIPSKEMKGLNTQQSAHTQSQSQSQSHSGAQGFNQRKGILTQSVSADSLATTGSPQSLGVKNRGMLSCEDMDVRKRASTPNSTGATSSSSSSSSSSPPLLLPLPRNSITVSGSNSAWPSGVSNTTTNTNTNMNMNVNMSTEGYNKGDGLTANISAMGSAYKPGNSATMQSSHLNMGQSNTNSGRSSDASISGAALNLNLLPPTHYTHMDEDFRIGQVLGPGTERQLFGYDVDFTGHNIESSPGKMKSLGQGLGLGSGLGQGSGLGSGLGQGSGQGLGQGLGSGAGQGLGQGSGAGLGLLSGTRSSIVTTASAGGTSSSDMDDDLDSDDEADLAIQDITAKYQDSVSRYRIPPSLPPFLVLMYFSFSGIAVPMGY